MTIKPGWFVPLCGLAPVILITLLSLYRPPILANLEYEADDALVRAVPARAPDGHIVIVDVDERSLSIFGQWPWRRDVIGDLVARLRDLGTKTIALDIIFAEPDRYGATGIDTDGRLAERLSEGNVVLGYALTFEPASARSVACVQNPLGMAVIRRGEEATDPYFRATGAICSLPILARAASGSGFLNAAPDPDGLLRRVPLLMELGGQVYPGLALAAVGAFTGTRDVALRVHNVNAASIMTGGRTVPVDGKSNLLLRYRGGKRTFPYVSAAAVLSGEARREAFSDRIVFVGTTALGAREVVATPLDTLFSGVEVQATVADNLLQQDFVHRPAYGVALETQLALALGVLVVLLVGRLGPVWGLLATAGSFVAVWGGADWVLSSSGALLSPLFPCLGAGSAFAASTLAQFTVERRRADREGRDKATSQRLMVQALLSLTEVRDAETGRHSRRTQEYTRTLARQLARAPAFAEFLTPERIDLLSRLAPLHDIGKVGVPDRLLNKPGALTADELVEMQRHPTHGRDVIVHAERDVGAREDVILSMAKDIVYTHHERWDGTGYPEGLQGAAIPIVGRLMALVDVYDAVITRRVYRQPMSHDQAVALIVAGRGTHFDPAIVDAFLEVADKFRNLSLGDSSRLAE